MLFAGIQERMHIVRLCLLAILSPIAVWNSGYDLKIAMNADETLTSARSVVRRRRQRTFDFQRNRRKKEEQEDGRRRRRNRSCDNAIYV